MSVQGPHLTVKPLERDDDHPPFVDRIARGYLHSTVRHPRTDGPVRRAYRTMAQVNEDLFNRIPITVEFTESDPYDDYADMKESVDRTGVLKIFSGGSEPEYLTHEQNVKGRAVHDYYGHLLNDCDFSIRGEFTKWYNMLDYYPKQVTQLLFSEVVAQVCVVHHTGGFDYDQRPVLAPSRWIEAVCDHYDMPVPEGAYHHDVRMF